MRRRRYRLVIQKAMEEQRSQAIQPPTTRAATLQPAEIGSAGPSWLHPAQQRVLDVQQQFGNQRAMALIQRAPKDTKEQEKESAAQEVVATADQVQGVNDPTSNVSLLAAAITAYKGKKYGTALIAFRELYRQSQSTTMLLNMAICELRLDLFHEAQIDLNDVLLEGSISPGDRTRAISALDAVKKLESAHSIGYMSLPSNIDTDNSPLAKDPRAIRHEISSLYRSAEGNSRSEDYEAALNTFKLAQKRLPHPVTMLNIGKIYVMLQRYSEAISAFEIALRDRQLTGGARKAAEAEREAAKHFQGKRLDMLGGAPHPPDENK